MPRTDTDAFRPESLNRPDPALLRHYAILSTFALVFFPLVLLPLYLRYRSLRYRLDGEGVSVSWGVLSRRETFLTYRRLQDIQVSQGLIQRKLGIAEVHLHTASGSAGPEMKLEGITDPARLRDFLYARMQDEDDEDDGNGGDGGEALAGAGSPDRSGRHVLSGSSLRSEGNVEPEEILRLLTEIRDELRARNRVEGTEDPGGREPRGG